MVRTAAALVALLASMPSAAVACPGVTSKTGALHLSSRDLAVPRFARVRAGGTVVLDSCGSVPGHGHVPFAPTAVIDLEAQHGRGLEIRTQGGCDAVLLARTARGNWFFDDDNGPGQNALLLLANPAGGRYRIWVGTYEPFGCDADLVLRTVATPRR